MNKKNSPKGLSHNLIDDEYKDYLYKSSIKFDNKF